MAATPSTQKTIAHLSDSPLNVSKLEPLMTSTPLPGVNQKRKEPMLTAKDQLLLNLPGISRKRKEPTVDAKDPLPDVNRKRNKPTVNAKDPLPGISEKQKEPTGNAKDPLPDVNRKRNKPTENAKDPLPNIAQKQKEPTVNTKNHLPGISEKQKEPTGNAKDQLLLNPATTSKSSSSPVPSNNTPNPRTSPNADVKSITAPTPILRRSNRQKKPTQRIIVDPKKKSYEN